MELLGVIFLLLNLSFIVLVIFLILSFFTGAPFVRTPKEIVPAMLDLANINKHDMVADFGVGDGRLLIAAARRGAKAIGWEINPILVLLSKFNAYVSGVSNNVDIKWGDYRRADINAVSVVLLYGITDKMERIGKKLSKELDPGSRVVSYMFSFPNLKVKKQTKEKLFYYKI